MSPYVRRPERPDSGPSGGWHWSETEPREEIPLGWRIILGVGVSLFLAVLVTLAALFVGEQLDRSSEPASPSPVWVTPYPTPNPEGTPWP